MRQLRILAPRSTRSIILYQTRFHRSFSQYLIRSNFSSTEIIEGISGSLPEYVMEKFRSDDFKNRVAIIDGSTGLSYTFHELFFATNILAHRLSEMGLKKGDRIAIISPNHVNYFIAFHSPGLIGASSTTLNPTYTVEEIRHVLEIIRPSIIIFHELVYQRVLEATSVLSEFSLISIGAGFGSLPGIDDVVKSKDPSTLTQFKPNAQHSDTITIPFSSGTTGKAKGVVLTHKNAIANCIQINYVEQKIDLGGDSFPTYMIPLPFFHIYGLVTGLCATLARGATVVTLPSFDFVTMLSNIQKYRVNRALLVPPIVLSLAKHAAVSQYDISSLKSIVSGAAPLGADIQELCEKRLRCKVRQAWGMTELSPVGAWQGHDEGVYGSSGPLVADTEAKIRDPITGEILRYWEEGELLIKGPQLMSGYYQNEEATSAAFTADGFFATGDIGRFDKDTGHLYITDRCKELIKYKGMQVPPAELEAVVASMPDVVDVVVIPVPDEEAGEIPRAYVVKRENATVTEQDIVIYVSGKVAPHKRLRGGVRFTDLIPKSASGKLLRRVQVQLDREALVKEKNLVQ